MSCHVSPTGGGVLTEYGRELSREALSQYGTEKESPFLYGIVKTPKWVDLGGDVRVLTIYQNTPAVREARLILMQADTEAAVHINKITVDATIGYREVPDIQPYRDHFLSRRHYLIYRPTDEFSFRVGKYRPEFGINTADHVIVTKRGLGWDEGSETYNFELAYIGEKNNTYLTAVFGRPDAKELSRETGIALSSSIPFGDTYKVGASGFYGTKPNRSRYVFGPFGILGFTPHFFLLSELDFQRILPTDRPSNNATWGAVNYQKLDYEFIQGLHGYLTQELSHPDFKLSDQARTTYGIGAQYYPRPHLDLSLTYEYVLTANVSEDTELLFLMLHFYL